MGRFLTRDAFSGFTANPLSMHKYVYVENNPVNFIDPFGDKAYIYWYDDDVIINWYVEYYGSDVTQDLADKYNEEIEKYWEKEIGKYNVVINITSVVTSSSMPDKWFSNYTDIEVIESDDDDDRSNISRLGDWGEFYTPIYDNWSPAHEFGHILGLKDHYKDTKKGSVPEKGYEGNIMGEWGGTVWESDITNILKINGVKQKISTPGLRIASINSENLKEAASPFKNEENLSCKQ